MFFLLRKITYYDNTKTPLVLINLALSELNWSNLTLKSNANPSKRLKNSTHNYCSTKKIDWFLFIVVDRKFVFSIKKLIYGSLIFDNMNAKVQLDNSKINSKKML